MNEQIADIMAKVFDVPRENINENLSQDTIENWDSIHHVRMIVLLERAFGISIPDEKVGNMINYKLIEAVVKSCTDSKKVA